MEEVALHCHLQGCGAPVIGSCSQEGNVNVMYLKELFAAAGLLLRNWQLCADAVC
jgi:hypothetical protein